MARRTKRENEETVEIFYGINPRTFEVDSVFLTRGGTLRKHGRDLATATHHILHGRDARTEIIIVWHLTDLVSFAPAMSGGEFAKEQLAELRLKADEMKAAEQAKSKR
jgi:hypothetical protein